MHTLRHLRTLLPQKIVLRVICVYLFIYLHLLYQSAKVLLVSIIYRPRVAISITEDLFLDTARKIMYYIRLMLGVRVIEKRLPHSLPKQIIIASNHQSYCDILIIRAYFFQHHIRFIASESMRRGFPGVSRLMRLQGHAFIKQSATSFSALKEIRRFALRLAGSDLSPIIFPEGRLARDGVLLPFFSAGLRQLSTHLDAPIALVLIRNSYQLNNITDLKKRRESAPISIEVLRCISDPKEKRRCARRIELLEQEYQAALQD